MLASQLIKDCLLNGRKILACGNGGSAADAADFTTEFACKFIADRRPYPAINISQSGSLITAIGNNYGFEEVFARQIIAFGQHDDLLPAISTNGNSADVRKALLQGRRSGLKTIALLGRNGGMTAGISDLDLIVQGQLDSPHSGSPQVYFACALRNVRTCLGSEEMIVLARQDRVRSIGA